MSNAEPRGKLLGPLRNGTAFLMVDCSACFRHFVHPKRKCPSRCGHLLPSPAVLSERVLLLLHPTASHHQLAISALKRRGSN